MQYMPIDKSIEKLGDDFPNLNWNFEECQIGEKKELISRWLGEPQEDIVVCVFKGQEIHEKFHRQDFFFINYAYKGDYGAQSYRFDNHLTIRENECYIGQPFSGYALYGASDKAIIIVGVLIKKEVFYRNFLQTISSDNRLLHFFLDPKINSFSDEFIRIENMHDNSIRALIELMVVEYANKQADTQAILKTMTMALIMLLSRQFRLLRKEPVTKDIMGQMIGYINEHLDHITLSVLSSEFDYHPAYISSQLSQKTGKTFSQILLSLRMERAVFLMKNTDLSIEEIAPMIGYTDKSNFHKAFLNYYGKTPRQFILEKVMT
jgi:AraC-like DNA-binding protein